MPPKKATKGKGKKGKGKGKSKKSAPKDAESTALSSQEQLIRMEASILALERKLEERTDEHFYYERVVSELRGKVQAYEAEWKDTVEERSDIIADMTRQFKEKQEQLCDQLNILENTLAELGDKLELVANAKKEIEDDKNYTVMLKERYLQEQNERAERLRNEFDASLRSLLERVTRTAKEEEERAGRGVGAFRDLTDVEGFVRRVAQTDGVDSGSRPGSKAEVLK